MPDRPEFQAGAKIEGRPRPGSEFPGVEGGDPEPGGQIGWISPSPNSQRSLIPSVRDAALIPSLFPAEWPARPIPISS